MEGLPDGVLIIGGLVLLGLAVFLVARYAKQILTFLLAVGGVAILALIAWALIQRPDVIPDDTAETIGDLADIARVVAPRSEPEPAYQAPAASGGGGFVTGLLTALVLGSLCGGGYCFARWKLAERGGMFPEARKRRRDRRNAPVVYVVQEPDAFDEMDEPWDLKELVGWDENEMLQF